MGGTVDGGLQGVHLLEIRMAFLIYFFAREVPVNPVTLQSSHPDSLQPVRSL